MAKIFDRHVLKLVQPFVSCNQRQFGFCARSGCGDAFLRLQLDVIQLCKRGRKSAVTLVSLDARKAFDQIRHSALLRALQRNGAPRWLLRVVADWLAEREFTVRVGESGASAWRTATSGSPQGASLSAVLFRNAVDPVFDLPLHEGTRIIAYADDLLVMRATGTAEERAQLEEDLLKVQLYLATLGLNLNVAKTQVLNISLDPVGHSWGGKLRMGTEELPMVPQMRYLGATVDSRLNFNAHWSRTAASAKAAVGALGRLVCRNERALRHLYGERVVSVLLHTLPFLPPSTQEAWRKVNGVASFAAHLITNDWRTHGIAAARQAGLMPPSELCFRQSMKFMFKCIRGRQRYGCWLEPKTETERASRNRSSKKRTGLEVEVPQTHLHLFALLQPIRAASTFNALPFLDAGLDVAKATASLPAFLHSLSALYQSLPPQMKKDRFGE